MLCTIETGRPPGGRRNDIAGSDGVDAPAGRTDEVPSPCGAARAGIHTKGRLVKVAIVTDEGQSVSPHFGRARGYLVLTVADGAVVEREMRPKAAPHLDGERFHGGGDGSHEGPAADERHDRMIAPIADCAFLAARGMGRGAYERIAAAGIRPIVTDISDPETAALACADGSIEDLVERLH
jgi:predicted Fe-Mo cluster-binding NifX family protein